MNMRQDSPLPAGTLLTGFLAGAALGAVVMALTAPLTGREARDRLRQAANRLRGGKEAPADLEDLADELVQAMFI